MLWSRPGDKPLSEPIMVNLLTHICVSCLQCANWQLVFMLSHEIFLSVWDLHKWTNIVEKSFVAFYDHETSIQFFPDFWQLSSVRTPEATCSCELLKWLPGRQRLMQFYRQFHPANHSLRGNCFSSFTEKCIKVEGHWVNFFCSFLLLRRMIENLVCCEFSEKGIRSRSGTHCANLFYYLFLFFRIVKNNYCQISNIRCTLVGNKIGDHSDVVGASPVGPAPTTSSFST